MWCALWTFNILHILNTYITYFFFSLHLCKSYNTLWSNWASVCVYPAVWKNQFHWRSQCTTWGSQGIDLRSYVSKKKKFHQKRSQKKVLSKIKFCFKKEVSSLAQPMSYVASVYNSPKIFVGLLLFSSIFMGFFFRRKSESILLCVRFETSKYSS